MTIGQLALAALLASVAAGQRVILIPTSSGASMSSPRGLSATSPMGRPGLVAEPPCRQRRLEPWRRHVRDQCGRYAEERCSPGQQLMREERDLMLRDPFDPMTPSSPHSMVTPASFFDLSREVDSFFDSLFAPPPHQRRSTEASSAPEDPFEAVLSGMMGFSLKAFDQMMTDAAGPTRPAVPVSIGGTPMVGEVISNSVNFEEGEEEVGEVEITGEHDAEPEPLDAEEGGPVPPSSDWRRKREIPVNTNEEEEEVDGEAAEPLDEEFSSSDYLLYGKSSGEEGDEAYSSADDFGWSEDESTDTMLSAFSEDSGSVQAVPTPERAAEDALDAMVAKLVQRTSAMQAQEDEAESEDASAEDGTEEVGPMFTVEDLPQRLFDMGSLLLTETGNRRRLQEAAEGQVDPRLQVKERLARRLTEYRADLFFGPDGTVTMYTSGSSGLPSPFTTPTHGHVAPPRPGLMGMGHPVMHPHNMRLPSAAETPLGMGSRHLDGCMKSLYDNGDLRDSCHQAVEQFYMAVDDRTMAPPAPSTPKSQGGRKGRIVVLDVNVEDGVDYWSVILPFAVVFVSAALLLNALFSACCDEYDDEEEEEEYDDDDDEMVGTQFRYVRLPEDGEEDAADGDKVFVGVPVQVV